MKTIYTFLFILSLLVSISSVFANNKPRGRQYNCKHIGIQKIKPFKHKSTKSHYNKPIVQDISFPKFISHSATL